MSKLSSRDVYVLTILAQHHTDPRSQARLLSRLSKRGLAIGNIIAKRDLTKAAVSDRDRAVARGFAAWAKTLS